MVESQKSRWVITVIVLLSAIILLAPNFITFGEDTWWPSKDKIVYGLDIQGGLHLVMGVDVDSVLVEKMARLRSSFEKSLKDEGIVVTSVTNPEDNPKQLVVQATDQATVERVQKYVEDFYPLDLQVIDTSDSNQVTLRYFDSRIQEYKRQVIGQAIEVIRNRIDEFGVSEPSISAQGADRILVQLPGIKDSATAKDLINRTARLSFRPVSEEISQAELMTLIAEVEKEKGYQLGKDELHYSDYITKLNEDLKSKLPKETRVVFEKNPNAKTLEAGKIPYLIKTSSDLDGSMLEDASVRPDQYGRPQVNFRFNVEGRRKFSQMTEDNVKGRIAIVLDNIVQSAPVIEEKINSDSAVINLGRGNYEETTKEANFIATALRAGALPAALQQLEERTVGPTLGADSIRKGKIAGIIGLVLVIVFMLVYYRTLGVVANIGLVFNMALLLSLLTALGATLTLPGVAGIVLTIGMAVDANVIIFERIKEELKKGSGLQAAIKDGFGNGFSAVFDSNVTTAAVCIVLMYFGTGPVRGFAVTLLCGIVTSMFTAIFVSRTLLQTMVIRFGLKKLA